MICHWLADWRCGFMFVLQYYNFFTLTQKDCIETPVLARRHVWTRRPESGGGTLKRGTISDVKYLVGWSEPFAAKDAVRNDKSFVLQTKLTRECGLLTTFSTHTRKVNRQTLNFCVYFFCSCFACPYFQLGTCKIYF